jgi:dTDP-4-dehydrorhamnose reductase
MTKQTRILLVGAGGFLGQAFARHLRQQDIPFLATARSPEPGQLKLDMEKPIAPQLGEALAGERFTHGVLCAAITEIGACYRNPTLSQRVNVAATEELLAAFIDAGIKPVFFSSDLVFPNTAEFYSEESAPAPSTLYGKQKLAVEELIRGGIPEYLIFRTSKLMSLQPGKRNILWQVIESLEKNEAVKPFHDQFITPVFIEDVAEVAVRAIRAGLNGTFHLAASERMSRLELARRICDRMGKSRELIQPVSMADFDFGEPRGRIYTINSEKIRRALNFEFRKTEAGLASLLPRSP